MLACCTLGEWGGFPPYLGQVISSLTSNPLLVWKVNSSKTNVGGSFENPAEWWNTSIDSDSTKKSISWFHCYNWFVWPFLFLAVGGRYNVSVDVTLLPPRVIWSHKGWKVEKESWCLMVQKEKKLILVSKLLIIKRDNSKKIEDLIPF